MFEAKIASSALFKKIIDTVKSVQPHVLWTLKRDCGLKMQAIDPTGSFVVVARLYPNFFVEFDALSDTYEYEYIGVNLSPLSSIVKTIAADFLIKRNGDQLRITSGSADSGERQFDMNLLHMILDELDIPNDVSVHTTSARISSSAFARICKDLRICGGYEVSIKYCNATKQIVFSTRGQICNATISIVTTGQCENDNNTYDECAWYSIDHLSALDSSLSENVWLHMTPGEPLKIEYCIYTGPLDDPSTTISGNACIHVAPRNHED